MPQSAPVAQWIERPPPKRQVAGSIPARGTIKSSSYVNTLSFSSEYIHWNKEGVGAASLQQRLDLRGRRAWQVRVKWRGYPEMAKTLA